MLIRSLIAPWLAFLAAPTPDVGWEAYGGDPGGSRHSAAHQIDRGNVGRLKVAWTFHTHALDAGGDLNKKAAFEATPLLFQGSLFVITPYDVVFALDPLTGVERFHFDPKIDRSLGYSEVTARGVSTWTDSQAKPGGPCRARIFFGTIDARLFAIDAADGKPCPGFGVNGQVDLTTGIRPLERGEYQVTSPPAIAHDVVVVGSSIGDNRAAELERGILRGFDARTGKLRWTFDTLPDHPATGAANAWGVISSDPARGVVYVPTGSPSPDFFGGQRKGDDHYANSVLALEAASGKLEWYFQVVHHDLWDYDVAAQPTLTTVQKDELRLPALIVATKMGLLFVLDRETGKPIFPVEERPVPKSDIPGEAAWPTQPFPSVIEPLKLERLRPEDAWGMTAEAKEACKERIASLRNEGLFTPPSLKGTINSPGNIGGIAWGGVAVDVARHLLIANTNRIPTVVRLIARDAYDDTRKTGENNRLSGEFGRQRGTPFGMYREPLIGKDGRPCIAPPWGVLSAIDLSTGKKRWEVPLGEIAGFKGSPSLGGPMVTAGGLVFISAAMDGFLRAFDVETGEELWKAELPAGGQATPMTYQIGGKQFVVIAAGGHGKLGTKQGDALVAFALSADQNGQ